MQEDISRLKEEEKTKTGEASYEETASGDHARRHGLCSWKNDQAFGLVLVAVGVAFLVADLTAFSLDNWWALFILIPAFSNLSRAWQMWRQNGRLTHSGRRALNGGLILTLIAAAFLFSISWGLVWPLLLIILGASTLLGSRLG